MDRICKNGKPTKITNEHNKDYSVVKTLGSLVLNGGFLFFKATFLLFKRRHLSLLKSRNTFFKAVGKGF